MLLGQLIISLPRAKLMGVSPKTYTVSLDGGTLQRGFWLYVWEVTTPDGDKFLYVGRTGDSSSVNAQSPFNRMGQHLGFLKSSSMLRNHLGTRGIVPEQSTFRLVARGPILEETNMRQVHYERRDLVGAMERKLAEDLAAAGYEVMNKVYSRKSLHEDMYAEVRAAFAQEFPGL
jgi:hypothetical protein